jgi:hypothetical protein
LTARAPGQQYLAQDPGQRERPDDAHYQKAVTVAQADQHEGRIGSGDQQVDRDVVEHFEDFFQMRRVETVIQRRHGIEQHQRAAEYGKAAGNPGIAGLYADSQQRAEADERENRPDQVTDTV